MSGSTIQSEIAYVRLASGDVAQLKQGATLPDDVLDGEAERLTAAGVLGELQATETTQPEQLLEQGDPADPTPVTEDDKPPRGRRS